MKETHGNWTALFSKTILQRGKAYFQSGKTKKLIEEPNGYSLTVRGSRNYTVHIGTDWCGDVESFSCTCPYAAGGEYCKHMAAALYYLESYYGEPFWISDNNDAKAASSSGKTENGGNRESSLPPLYAQSSAEPKASGGAKTSASENTGTAASKNTGGSARSGSSAGADYFSDIAKLQKNELAVRQSETPASPFVPSDYRYFDNPDYLSDIKSRESDRKKARALVRKKDRDDINVSV